MRLAQGLLMSSLLCAGAGATGTMPLRIGVEGAYPPFSQVGPDGELSGFDIDIARALCAQMQTPCELVQQNFDGMIPALNASKIDAVIASLSITAERKQSVDFSDKYYKTPGRLVARRGSLPDASVAGLADRRIGVQRASSYDRFATDSFVRSEIVRYTKQDDAFLDLASGRIDAVLCDSVAAHVGFLSHADGADFAFAGPLFVQPEYFGEGAGIAVRKGDTVLRDKLNAAIAAIRTDGTYTTIQSRYVDFNLYEDAPAAHREQSGLLLGYGNSLLRGAALTLVLALCSLGLALSLGVAGCAAKLSRWRMARTLATVYTTVIRAVPDLVLMLLVFFGGQVMIDRLLAQVRHDAQVDIDPFVAGVATLGFIYGAYFTESLRGAYLAIPTGQIEAAVAFGMKRSTLWHRVLAPQMLRHALSPLLNNWLVLIKSTAIVSVIGLTDLTQRAGLAAGATHQPFLFYAVVGLVYLGFCAASEGIAAVIQRTLTARGLG